MSDLRTEHNVVTDEYTSYIDKPDEDSYDQSGYAGGTFTQYSETDASGTISGVDSAIYAHPDQSEYAKLLTVVRTAIQQELDRERKAYDVLINSAVRVTTNLSGQTSFARYTIPANQPVQIAREKALRGELVIVNYTDTQTVYVGLHVGIMVAGSDTAAIVGTTTGTSRRIRTRRALWAIASTACVIDVQEEFD